MQLAVLTTNPRQEFWKKIKPRQDWEEWEGVYLPMYNLYLKIRVKTKVSGVVMSLIPFRRGLTGAQLWHGRTNPCQIRKSERGALLGTALSPLLLGVCLIHTAGGVPPPILFQQAFTGGKRYLTVPRTKWKSDHFPQSLIPSHCTYKMLPVRRRAEVCDSHIMGVGFWKLRRSSYSETQLAILKCLWFLWSGWSESAHQWPVFIH